MGEKREHAGWKLQVGGRVRSDTRWPDFTPGVCATRVKSLTSCASQRYREPSLPGPNMRTPEVNNIQCRGNAESASWVLAMMLLLLKENPRQSPAGPIALAALRYQGRLSLHFLLLVFILTFSDNLPRLIWSLLLTPRRFPCRTLSNQYGRWRTVWLWGPNPCPLAQTPILSPIVCQQASSVTGRMNPACPRAPSSRPSSTTWTSPRHPHPCSYSSSPPWPPTRKRNSGCWSSARWVPGLCTITSVCTLPTTPSLQAVVMLYLIVLSSKCHSLIGMWSPSSRSVLVHVHHSPSPFVCCG